MLGKVAAVLGGWRPLALVGRHLVRRWVAAVVVVVTIGAIQLCILLSQHHAVHSARVQLEAVGGVPCSAIPVPDRYWRLTAANSPPFVAMPLRTTIEAGQSVCVRVVVPAKPTGVLLTYTPFPESPWDSVLLDLVGTATGISVPVALQMTAHAQNYHRSATHIYEANVVLRDADTYRPQGVLEFRDARWNPDAGLSPAEYQPEELRIPRMLKVIVVDRDGLSPFSLQRHMALPLCTTLESDGRWVPQALLQPLLDAEQKPAVTDAAGRAWLPYACRLRRIAYSEFAQCLQSKHPLMHWYGDSNLRRALKKITTLGDWCARASDIGTKSCRCEDYHDKFAPFDPSQRSTVIELSVSDGGRTVDKVGANSTVAQIYYHKWEGLSGRNSPPWHARFEAGITQAYGQPNMVVVSLVNWDAAYSARAEFSASLDRLLGYLEREYAPAVRFIIRTGQYFCCRSDSDQADTRSYSRLRNAFFDRHVVRAFTERLGPARILGVWNVAAITERRPMDARRESISCNANHAPADIVDVENQVLFNALCNSSN
ncbi:hypothetical protein H4R19_001049 [Coemansia spiralis]|nr:hypothetical protein H4R19_001049 [Coemansia spiralis]